MINKNKRVVFIITHFPFAGSERVVYNLFKGMKEQNIESFLILVSPEKIDESSKEEFDLLESINLVGRLRHVTKDLLKTIRTISPDYIISSAHHSNLILGFFKSIRYIRSSLILREPSSVRYSSTYNSLFRSTLDKLYTKFAYSSANYLIFQTERLKDEFLDFYKLKNSLRFLIMPNPVDFTNVRRLSEVKPNPFSSSRINIVAVGRFKAAKRYDVLIEAFYQVRYHEPKATLHIFGGGILKQLLIDQIEKLGLEKSVILYEFEDNPYVFIKYADLFVSSSEFEGFSNSLIEAAYLSGNIVLTDCFSGPQELFGIDYEGLVPVNDSYELAKKMRQSLNEPINKTINLDGFDYKNVSKQYIDLMKDNIL